MENQTLIQFSMWKQRQAMTWIQRGFNVIVPAGNVVPTWYQRGTNVVPTWYQRGTNVVPTWYQRGINVVSTWY